MSWAGWARCLAERALPCASEGLARCAIAGLGYTARASMSSGLVPSARVALELRPRCDGERVSACIAERGHIESKAAAIGAVSECYREQCGAGFR